MTKRYDVTCPREYQDRDGNKKTSWINLGIAFEKDGRISILLNALPMPGADGQAKLILMEPKQDDRGGSSSNYRDPPRERRPAQDSGHRVPMDDLDDNVPF